MHTGSVRASHFLSRSLVNSQHPRRSTQSSGPSSGDEERGEAAAARAAGDFEELREFHGQPSPVIPDTDFASDDFEAEQFSEEKTKT